MLNFVQDNNMFESFFSLNIIIINKKICSILFYFIFY